LKLQIWDFYIGNKIGSARCMCCNVNEILLAIYEAGHIIPESKGGDTNLQNLMPICPDCNRSMGANNMQDFMKRCGYKIGKNW
jgi:hypothetical protein